MVAGASDLARGGRVGVRVTVSLGRDRRGPCDPGRYQDWVAGKVRARALGRIRSRRHSGVSALLKGRAYFIPPTQRHYIRQSSAPALKGNCWALGRPPAATRSGSAGSISALMRARLAIWAHYAQSCPSSSIVLSTLGSGCLSMTHSHQKPPRWFVCSSFHPSIYLCNTFIK